MIGTFTIGNPLGVVATWLAAAGNRKHPENLLQICPMSNYPECN